MQIFIAYNVNSELTFYLSFYEVIRDESQEFVYLNGFIFLTRGYGFMGGVYHPPFWHAEN